MVGFLATCVGKEGGLMGVCSNLIIDCSSKSKRIIKNRHYLSSMKVLNHPYFLDFLYELIAYDR